MTTRRRKFSERSAVDRAFLTGFARGHCLGQHEAMKSLRNEFEPEFEALTDHLRHEVNKTVNEFRDTWGMGPPSDPNRPKFTVQ